MESLFFHPKLVHLPLGLSIILPLIALVLLVSWWRGWLSPGCWRLVLGLQLVLVVASYVAMQAGERDEERIEQIVAEEHIEHHEEAAELFFWVSVVVLGLALASAALPGQRTRGVFAVLTLLGTVAVLVLAIRTGQAGGDLVYRHGAAAAYTSGGSSAPAGDDDRDDAEDDDHD